MISMFNLNFEAYYYYRSDYEVNIHKYNVNIDKTRARKYSAFDLELQNKSFLIRTA